MPAETTGSSRTRAKHDRTPGEGQACWGPFQESIDFSDTTPSRSGDGQFPQQADALWDSYLLFDRDATWNGMPSGVLSWGFTVMRTRQQLAADLQYALTHVH
jgi:hypothetical protein